MKCKAIAVAFLFGGAAKFLSSPVAAQLTTLDEKDMADHGTRPVIGNQVFHGHAKKNDLYDHQNVLRGDGHDGPEGPKGRQANGSSKANDVTPVLGSIHEDDAKEQGALDFDGTSPIDRRHSHGVGYLRKTVDKIADVLENAGPTAHNKGTTPDVQTKVEKKRKGAVVITDHPRGATSTATQARKFDRRQQNQQQQLFAAVTSTEDGRVGKKSGTEGRLKKQLLVESYIKDAVSVKEQGALAFDNKIASGRPLGGRHLRHSVAKVVAAIENAGATAHIDKTTSKDPDDEDYVDENEEGDIDVETEERYAVTDANDQDEGDFRDENLANNIANEVEGSHGEANNIGQHPVPYTDRQPYYNPSNPYPYNPYNPYDPCTYSINYVPCRYFPAPRPAPRPTKAPTKPPTKPPTDAPTKAPTSSPTKAPTASPTETVYEPLSDDTIRDAVHEWYDIATRPAVVAKYGPIEEWDVSKVTNMDSLFYDYYYPDGDLSKWNVSSVTSMDSMFQYAHAFNSDISQWDVSSVTNMDDMFYWARDFNSDISQWDVSSVTNMGHIFAKASSFNSDLSQWDVSSVTNMGDMFYEASSFNSDLSQWDVSAVTNMRYMFEEASSFNSDISQWDVSSVTDMAYMFDDALLFSQQLCWDTSQAYTFLMFRNSKGSLLNWPDCKSSTE